MIKLILPSQVNQLFYWPDLLLTSRTMSRTIFTNTPCCVHAPPVPSLDACEPLPVAINFSYIEKAGPSRNGGFGHPNSQLGNGWRQTQTHLFGLWPCHTHHINSSLWTLTLPYPPTELVARFFISLLIKSSFVNSLHCVNCTLLIIGLNIPVWWVSLDLFVHVHSTMQIHSFKNVVYSMHCKN